MTELLRIKYENQMLYKFDQHTDVNRLSLAEIHMIITDAMYYSKLTESDAYTETINFEI